MDLVELEKNWEELARQDPMWAILTDPAKQGQRWDPVEFFATGEREVERALVAARTLRLPRKHETALDFGCGVGRLTQALAGHFQHCTGIDISTTMIEQARRHNRAGARCTYMVNDRDDLRRFADGSFDLIYSIIVLQHMRPHFALRYVNEFARVLAPGGLLVFQVPLRLRSTPWEIRRRLHLLSSRVSLMRRLGLRRPSPRSGPTMEMHGVARHRITRALRAGGATLLRVEEDDAAGPEWISHRYFATKG